MKFIGVLDGLSSCSATYLRARRSSLVRFASVVTLVVAGNTAQAGLITIKADPGSSPLISWSKTNDNGITTYDFAIKNDANGDGIIEFGFGTLEEEKRIGSVFVIKRGDGDYVQYELKLNINGESLGSLEPFNFPTFAASTALLASIDVLSLKSLGSVSLVGQSFAVTDGIAAETSSIIFRDSSSLAENSELSPEIVASLPYFTGSVKIYSIDYVSPVPLPATSWMLGSGLIALAGIKRKAFKSS